MAVQASSENGEAAPASQRGSSAGRAQHNPLLPPAAPLASSCPPSPSGPSGAKEVTQGDTCTDKKPPTLQDEMAGPFVSRLDRACIDMLAHISSAPSSPSALSLEGPNPVFLPFDEDACLLPKALAWARALPSAGSADAPAELSSSAACPSRPAPSKSQHADSPALPARPSRECGHIFVALEPFLQRVLGLPARQAPRAVPLKQQAPSASCLPTTEEKAASAPGGSEGGEEATQDSASRLFPYLSPTVLKRVEALLERPPVGLIGVARFGAASAASAASPPPSPSAESAESFALPDGDPQVLVVRPLMPAASGSQASRKRKRNATQSSGSPASSPPAAASASFSAEASPDSEANYSPFPTTFWLCDERLRRDISTLEVRGRMKSIEERIQGDEELEKSLVADHLRYIAIRWLLLPVPVLRHFYCLEDATPERRETEDPGNAKRVKTDGPNAGKEPQAAQSLGARAEAEEGDSATQPSEHCRLCRLLHVLRQRGIGGIATFSSMRCLHMHYGFHLVLPPTTVGQLIDEELGKLREEEEELASPQA
ncbi:hypothetical protein BESB_016690 [Besnoitia besnoiti]|uniref:Uncharacterized protein n=1 Tax=Besnoitia besnoiti TaxID=94643 RepID=A0A2A9M7T6_BESBE|nr:hypothetical protein BESB_016690 [Besnoitia besnoiti]PFH32351.1 hypothetical protein BESB_016690 [Besnoitia besnoiti]